MPKTRIDIDDISVDVIFKNIKNIHLSVIPPDGIVRVSAPGYLKLESIREFVISKLNWIRKQTDKLKFRARQTPSEFLEGENHFVWGKGYRLSVVEKNQAPLVQLEHNRMILTLRPGADQNKKRAVVDAWYRDEIKNVAPSIIVNREKSMGVRVEKLFVRRMKTRWGTCNVRKGTIRLNTDLARRPLECLEYIIVHEMTHLLEPSHNRRFKLLMDSFLPGWRQYRDMLNRSQVG